MNELDMPANEDEPLDNTFRQTVFNPKQPNPAKMISIQVNVPERLATDIDCSSADSKPLESKTSQRPGTHAAFNSRITLDSGGKQLSKQKKQSIINQPRAL